MKGFWRRPFADWLQRNDMENLLRLEWNILKLNNCYFLLKISDTSEILLNRSSWKLGGKFFCFAWCVYFSLFVLLLHNCRELKQFHSQIWKKRSLLLKTVYTVNRGVDLYVDNTLVGDDHNGTNASKEVAGSIIVLGRYYADDHDSGHKYGDFTIDYLTIWDKPLGEAERNLL